MAEMTRKDAFINKYKDIDKIWSGDSFINYLELQALLSELPISAVAEASKTYAHSYTGILEYVYGTILHTLTSFESILKDRDAHINECFMRPIIRPNNITVEFKLQYKTKAEEEGDRSCEVIRNGERSFIFFY